MCCVNAVETLINGVSAFLYRLSISFTCPFCFPYTAGLSDPDIVGVVFLVILILTLLVFVVAVLAVLLWLKKKKKMDICWCLKCWKPISNTNDGNEPGHRKHSQCLQVSNSFVNEHQFDDTWHQNTYSITTDQQTLTLYKEIQYSVQDILSAIDPTDEASGREGSSKFVSAGSPSWLTGPEGNPSSVSGGAGLTAAADGPAPDEVLSNKVDPTGTRSIALTSLNPTAVSAVNIEPNSAALNEAEHALCDKHHEILAVKDSGFTEDYKRESMLCEIDKEFWGADLELVMFSY